MLYKPERVGGKISLKITVEIFFFFSPCTQKTYGVVSDIIVLAQVLTCCCSFLTSVIAHAI